MDVRTHQSYGANLFRSIYDAHNVLGGIVSYEYFFENLTGIPSVGMLEIRIAELIGKSLVDISQHPEEHWLKAWFGEELSDDEETILNGIVDDSLGVKNFRIDTGSVFFELQDGDNKRWQKHTRRVNFNIPFQATPTIVVSNAYFDGAADIEIINTTKTYFDFQITSTKAKGKSSGFNSIEFTWEARSWLV